MKKRIFCLLLCALLLLPLAACGSERGGYRIVDTYSGEGNFRMAFRKGDALCELLTAALQELAANGTLSSAAVSWFGEDIAGLRGKQGALEEYQPVESRTLTVGVNPNAMPLSYADGDSYAGFDVDLINYLCGLLGWSMILRPISADELDVQLQSGNIDCAMGVTEQQMDSKNFSYSPVYLKGKYVLVTSLSGPIRSKAGLRGKALGVVLGDLDVLNSDERFVSRLDRIIYQTGTQGLFAALDAGEVDGILVAEAAASYYLR